MLSLKQILYHPPSGGGGSCSSSASGERREPNDRRIRERRSNIYPLESREARLRFAAQAAGFGTYDLDCLTGESLWSPELRAMAGLDSGRAPLSNEDVENLIHPDDRASFLNKLSASLDPAGSGEFEHEYRIRRPDGSIQWVETKGRTFFVGEGPFRRPLAATGVVMDITAKRLADKKLAESQEELDKMVASAIDSIVTIDADQRIIRFNPAAARMFGCTPEEAMGSTVERFMPERFRADHPDKVRRFAEGEISAQALDSPRRFTGLRANGEEFPFESSVIRVSLDGGTRMTTFMRDISDRIRAEEALRRSKEDLELAVRGANIGIWHLDIRTGKVEWSERTYQLFGLPPGDPIDFKRVLTTLHPDDRPRVLAAVRKALMEGHETHGNFDCRVVRPDGSIRWIVAMGSTIYDQASNKAVGLRGIALDITRRKKQEDALRRSKEDMELAVRGANIGIWHRDLQTGIVEFSERQYQLMGIPLGERVTQERYLAVIHPEDRPQIESAVRQALKRGEMYDIEFRVAWPDGSIHWLACMGRILYDGDSGRALGVRGITLDITERKLREVSLKTQKERLEIVVKDRTDELARSKAVLDQFRIFIEQAPSNISMFDRDMNYLAASLGWCRTLNVDLHELIGRNHYELNPDIPEAWKEAHRLALEGTPKEKDEDLWVQADGTERWIHWGVYPWRDVDGKIGGIVIAGEDITQRKQAERALAEEREARQRMLTEQVAERTTEVARSNEALVRSNIELKHFAHAAAHDLQTPLRSIAGFAQLLEREAGSKLSGQEIDWLRQVTDNTKRLQKLIQELLTYARLDSQARPFEMTDLKEVFDEVVGTLAVLIREAGAEVTCNGLPTLPVDRTQFAQLLQNLIENAIKYRSHEPPRVSISGERQDGEWIFAVADNGIGIDPKHRDRIFEIFRRLHTYSDIPGTGIGLAICQTIVERHGGRIWVESLAGRGSIFRFTLPDRREAQ